MSCVALTCHMYLVIVGALLAAWGVIYKNFKVLVITQFMSIWAKISTKMMREKEFFYHIQIIFFSFFAPFLHSLLHPLLSCTPRCDTDAKCCNIWPMLHLYLAVLRSFLGVMGDSPCRREQWCRKGPNTSQNAPIYAYICVYTSIQAQENM